LTPFLLWLLLSEPMDLVGRRYALRRLEAYMRGRRYGASKGGKGSLPKNPIDWAAHDN
jgi:hypothetical protein